jgi:hypothetical protein
MTIASSLGLLLIVGGSLWQPARKAPEDASTLYLVHDAKKDLWCGYHEEGAWRAAIAETRATETASVDFVKKIPKVVKVTKDDDLGANGWIVFDRYYLNDAGLVMSLQRATNVFADDVSRSEILEARNGGHLAVYHVKFRSIQTDSPMTRSDASFPSLPITARLRNFPFGELIERVREVFAQNSLCVPPREAMEERAHSR